MILQTAVGSSPRIPDSYRRVHGHGIFHHIGELPFVLGRHDSHVGHRGKVGQIEDTLMCLAVSSHEPCPVYRKHHMEIAYAYVMEHLVICPLQEG